MMDEPMKTGMKTGMPAGTTTGASRTASTPGATDGEIAHSETATLIAADKVEGTNVYDHSGNKLGSIDTVMIDKSSGQVSYAVLAFGGFLGMGQSRYPLPWQRLRYDTTQDGYVVGITEEQLRGAPHYEAAESADWTDNSWRGSIDDYYGRDGVGRGTVPTNPLR